MLTAASNDIAQAYVLQPDEGQVIENLGLRLLAADARTGGSLLAAVVNNPGVGGPPLHTHATIDELYFVLRGDTASEFSNGTTKVVPAPLPMSPVGLPTPSPALAKRRGSCCASRFQARKSSSEVSPLCKIAALINRRWWSTSGRFTPRSTVHLSCNSQLHSFLAPGTAIAALDSGSAKDAGMTLRSQRRHS